MNKTILITGASQGIGKETAKYLADKGNRLVLVARNQEKLNLLASELGDETVVVSYDLNDLEHIDHIFQVCYEQGIKLDGMIHCAGINRDMPVRTNDVEEMKQVFNTNCLSFLELGKYFIRKKYSNENASIVAISSTASQACVSGMATYSGSKAALNAFVKVMSKEFAKRKVRVNAILPAFVDTEMARATMDYVDDFQSKLAVQPFGIIEPIHISYMTEFLLSDKAAYVTGQMIPITAG